MTLRELLLVFLPLLYLPRINCQCIFPLGIQGTWIRASDGRTFSISSTTIVGFQYFAGGREFNNFRCGEVSGNNYLFVEDQNTDYLGRTKFAYLCFSVITFSSNSILFTDLATVSADLVVNGSVPLQYVNGQLDTNPSLTVLDVCSSDPAQVQSNIFYRDGIGGTVGAVGVTCPDSILGNYNYTIDGSNCGTNSSLAVCIDRKSMTFDYSLCPDTVAYTSGGVVDCIGSVTWGVTTYLWVFNRDAAVDGNTTHRTACLAIVSSGNSVSLTTYPTDCLSGQNSTVIPSPGRQLDLSAIAILNATTSVPVAPVVSAGIVGGAVGGVLLLLLLIILIVLFVRIRNRKMYSIHGASSRKRDSKQINAGNSTADNNNVHASNKPHRQANGVSLIRVTHEGGRGSFVVENEISESFANGGVQPVIPVLTNATEKGQSNSANTVTTGGNASSGIAHFDKKQVTPSSTGDNTNQEVKTEPSTKSTSSSPSSQEAPQNSKSQGDFHRKSTGWENQTAASGHGASPKSDVVTVLPIGKVSDTPNPQGTSTNQLKSSSSVGGSKGPDLNALGYGKGTRLTPLSGRDNTHVTSTKQPYEKFDGKAPNSATKPGEVPATEPNSLTSSSPSSKQTSPNLKTSEESERKLSSLGDQTAAPLDITPKTNVMTVLPAGKLTDHQKGYNVPKSGESADGSKVSDTKALGQSRDTRLTTTTGLASGTHLSPYANKQDNVDLKRGKAKMSTVSLPASLLAHPPGGQQQRNDSSPNKTDGAFEGTLALHRSSSLSSLPQVLVDETVPAAVAPRSSVIVPTPRSVAEELTKTTNDVPVTDRDEKVPKKSKKKKKKVKKKKKKHE